MTKNRNIESIKHPIVEIDNSLDNKENCVYATKKLAKANAFLAKAGLPSTEKQLTPLQVELLQFYTLNPTETQMQLLRDFLTKLLSNAFEPVGAK
jgi:hypothetical protein